MKLKNRARTNWTRWTSMSSHLKTRVNNMPRQIQLAGSSRHRGKFKMLSIQSIPSVTRNPRICKVSLSAHNTYTMLTAPGLIAGKCQGLTVTPFNAGHTIGGTIWKIRSPSSGTIIYAVNLNHMKERHLDGTVLLRTSAGGVSEPLARPDLLITDAERASVISSRRKDRDAALIGMSVEVTVQSYILIFSQTPSRQRCRLNPHSSSPVIRARESWNYSCFWISIGITRDFGIQYVCSRGQRLKC